MTYSVVVLFAYFISNLFGLTQQPVLRSLWKDPILALCLNLVALPLFEHLGPDIIRIFANIFKRVRSWSMKMSPLYVHEASKRDKKRTTGVSEEDAEKA